ncbi:MAG: hypothetical protein OXC91_10810, partial [Rhodobacteraceae bacterium]|nr:hypothetical protein [Paracoccaceae bacterium]
MRLHPDRQQFAGVYDQGKNQIVAATIPADLDTPVSLYMKLAGNRKDSFLLESVTGGEIRGRYSILGLDPDLIWECRGSHVVCTHPSNAAAGFG